MLWLQRLGVLVPVGGHPRVWEQEVIDRAWRTAHLERRLHPFRGLVEPKVGLPRPAEPRLRIHLPPRPDERVADDELEPEPRHVAVLVDAIQPQGDLGKFHRHRVQVHAVHVPVGDVVPHLLQLVGVVRVGYPLPEFALPPLQIALRELVHCLVQERRRPHRRLADRQVEDAIGGHVVGDQLLEGVLDDAAGQRFGGVVAGRLLAVPSGEPVDEASLWVDAELLPPLVVQVVHPLGLGVLVEVAGRDKPGVFQVVRVVLRLLDLVQVLLREEPPVGKERLIHRAELVDAELRVGDAAPPPAPGPWLDGLAT